MFRILYTFLFCLFALTTIGQDHIKITGTVIDANTKETLPFATVNFVGNESVGTTTDLDGAFILETRWGTDSLMASYVGYQPLVVTIQKGVKKQTINFELESDSEVLNTVEVKAKKKRYRRKNNPAVALIKNVIKNKDKNRMGGQDYFEYDRYEKLEYAMNNFQDDFFEKKKALKKFKFLSEYVDTSTLNGKPFLPFYIRETASKVYYRRNPETKKEYREGVQMTGIEEWVDNQSLSVINDAIYQDVDIFENNIDLLRQSFLSPLNSLSGNLFYRYYIVDTIEYKGMDVIEMAFLPTNSQDVGFKGSLYILNDSTYALVKADLSFTDQINMNWINDFNLIQEFEKKDDYWILAKDVVITDFAASKKMIGAFIKRTVMHNNQKVGVEREPHIYAGSKRKIDANNLYNKDATFWQNARQEELTEQEEEIYEMVDTLKTVRPFRNVMNAISAASSGYIDTEYFEFGSIFTFFGFNEVEGVRLKLGGTTSPSVFQKLQLEGYGAYGLRDQKFKYGAAATFSFKDSFRGNPQHFIRASYYFDNKQVGQPFDFRQKEFFLFQRGITSRMLQLKSFETNYFYEFENDLWFEVSGIRQNHKPLGTLTFNYTDPIDPGVTKSIDNFNLTALRLKARWAPNEIYTQGKNFRHPVYGRNPFFILHYEKGLKGPLGGDYNYHKVELEIFKRFYTSPFGFSDVFFEAGKVFGKGVPYHLLLLPKANQSFFTKHRFFNLMDYLEFVNDSYVAVNLRHRMKGYLFNKIPVIKKLNWREVITFKGVWGVLSDDNNPNTNPEYIQFLRDENDEVVTRSLGAKPYIEISAGIENIFKVGKISLIRRITYLDNPNTPQLFGIRGLAIRGYLGVGF